MLKKFPFSVILLYITCYSYVNGCLVCPHSDLSEFICGIDDGGIIQRFNNDCFLKKEVIVKFCV